MIIVKCISLIVLTSCSIFREIYVYGLIILLCRVLYQEVCRLKKENKGTLGMLKRLPSGKIALQNGIKLHLYISKAPCGDGSVFTLRYDLLLYDIMCYFVTITNIENRTLNRHFNLDHFVKLNKMSILLLEIYALNFYLVYIHQNLF